MALTPATKIQGGGNGLIAGTQIQYAGEPAQPLPSDKRDALGAGFEAAGTGLTQGLPYATMKALGIATPEDDKYYQQKFQESAQKQQTALPGGPKSIFSNNPIQGFGETLAYSAPQMASELGAGAVAGGLATLAAGPEAGAAAGMAATGAVAFPQYVGSNAISATDNGNQPLSKEAAQRSFVAAGGQSVLDAGASALGAKALLGEGFTGNLLVRAGKGAAEGTVLGAGDQLARGVGTQYAAGKDLGSPESLQEDIEGAGVGGVMGGAFGGPLGVFKKAKVAPTDTPPVNPTPAGGNLLKAANGELFPGDNLGRKPGGGDSAEAVGQGLSDEAISNYQAAQAQRRAITDRMNQAAQQQDAAEFYKHQSLLNDHDAANPPAQQQAIGDLLNRQSIKDNANQPDLYSNTGPKPNPLSTDIFNRSPPGSQGDLFRMGTASPESESTSAPTQPTTNPDTQTPDLITGKALVPTLPEFQPDRVLGQLRGDAPFVKFVREGVASMLDAIRTNDPVQVRQAAGKLLESSDKATPRGLTPEQHEAFVNRAYALAQQFEATHEHMDAQAAADQANAQNMPHVESALANAPTHPNATDAPPVMVDPVTHAKMIRDAEKEALAAHQHELKLQDAHAAAAERAAEQAKKVEEAAHAQRMARVEHSNRTQLIDRALNDPKINDPAAWVIAHLKRFNFDNKDLTPLERQRIMEHERNNLRLNGAEPMGNPKEGEDVPRAERAPESPDFANSDQLKMFDKDGKVLSKVKQEGPTNKAMETERAKAHTAAEAISNVRAEIEAKPDAPNSEVVDAIAHGIRQITDNVPAKDRLEALSVLKNEHGERLFNAAMERADSMKGDGEKPASKTNKDKIQATQPEPKPETENPEVTKAKADVAVRDHATKAFQDGLIDDKQRRTVEAAIERGDVPHEEMHTQINKWSDATRDRGASEKPEGPAPRKTSQAVIPNRREVLGAGAAAAVTGTAPRAEAAGSPREKLASMIKDPKASNASILDHIAATGTALQKIQAAILHRMPGVNEIGRDSVKSDANGKIDPKADPWVRGQLQDARGVSGLDPDNNHFMLFQDSLDPSSDGMNPEVFLHEMFHAVIQQRYGQLEDYHPTSKTGRAADAAILEWKDKWKRITEGLKQNVNLEEIGKTDRMAATGLSEIMRNPDEALSWVRTNEETRAFLDTIDMDGNVIPPQSPKLSVWDHIVDFVKKLFGIKDPTQVSALEELMKTSDQMLSHARLDTPDLKEYMNQPLVGHDDSMRKSSQMFVGKDAQGADRGRLAEAKMREAAGQDAGWHSDIHEETGWHKTPGGDWAYEVSDHDAAFHGNFKDIPEGEHKLSDVFSAPEAFHAYPELKDIVFKKEDLGDRVGGRFDASTNTITVSSSMPESEVKNTILHEMQHWVQNKEDFARGGSENNQVSTSKTLDKLHAFYKDRIDSLQSSYDRLRQMVGDDMSHNNIREYYERSGVDSKEAGRMATRERNNVVMAYRTAQDRLKYVEQFREHADTVDAAAAQTRKSTTDIKSTADTHNQMQEATRAHVAKLTEEYNKAKASGATPEELASIRQQYDQIKQAYAQLTRATQSRIEQSRGKRAQSEAVLDVSRKDMNASGLGTDAYNNLAGEVQARATGDSAGLTPAQRKARNPYTDQGVKPEHQLITRDKVANDSVRSPEEHDEPVEHLTDAMNRPNDAKPGKLPENPMARGAADMALNVRDTTRRTMLNLRTMEQLAERYKHLPMIKAIKDMLDVQARERDDLIRAGGIIHHLGRALPKDQQEGLSLVFDAERHQVDVLDPEARTNIDNSPEAQDIHDRFAKLSPEAQDVYRQMIEAGKAKAETAKKIYAETINGMTNLDEETKGRLIRQMEAKFSRPVYFPHVWDGDFITIGKSKEFKDAEAAGDHDTMEKLRTDGDHYIVRASKTAADQRALVQAMREEGMDVNIKKREQFQASTDIVPDKFMRIVNQGLDDHIRANPDMAEGLRGMKEMLNETRYSMMPDGSQLANKFKRKGVQGFETDALGVFARTTKRDADYLTKLKYNTGVRQELDDLSVKARENQSNADMDVSEQMRKHFNSLGKYHNSGASKILNNLTYAYYLGMSPSFMVMHLMQTPMITAPYLGARFNPTDVSAELAKAGAEGLAGYRRLMKNEGNEQIFGKTADEKEALKFAATRGLFQATQAHSLLIDAAGGGTMDHIAAAAMHAASYLPHHTERYNRLITYLAAYRLAMKNPDVIPALDAETHAKASGLTPGKFDLTPQQLAAARFAQDTVNTTHVDYSGHNAAHIMQPGVVPFGEVMFQFQKYQQGMLSILGDSLADVFSKKSPEERWIAGKTLAGILTTHAAVTGLMGLPLVGTAVMLSNIYHKFFGDKDRPFDGDDALQKKMIETFGPTWGEVGLRGMLYAPGIKQLAPVDVTDRLGLGDVLAPTRQVGKINSDEWLKYIGSIAGGPSGSLLGQFADAYDYHHHGDDWKASEELMPKVMRDISRTIRFYNEGVTSKSGNQVITAEDMRNGPAFAQLAGFEPQKLQETYANRRSVQNAIAELQDRRKVLMKEATDARSSGDQARLQRVMADIQRYNDVRTKEGTYSQRIKGAELMRSFRTRQKNNASLDHGVALKHSQQDLGMYSLGEGTENEQPSE
jgi:hypothetical protein